MKPIYFYVSVLVLFNAISPLVSASIKIPHKEEENVLKEHLSDLFDGLEEDPIIDEISVMEVNTPQVMEDDFVTIDGSIEGFPESLCHPKDLSCPSKVTLIDTVTGEEVEGIVVDDRNHTMENGSKTDPDIVKPVDVEHKVGGKNETLSTDNDRVGRALNGTKISPAEKPKNESKKDEEGKKKQTLLSILQGKTNEAVSEGVAKGEELEDDVNEKVVHLNKHIHKTTDDILAPIKERSDEILHDVGDKIEEANHDVHEKSKGVFDAVFKMFG